MLKKIIAAIFLLCSFATLVALGLWQVERLQWKDDIIAELDKRNDLSPVETALTLNKDSQAFDRGFITGQFLYNAPPLFVGPRTHNKESGYHVHQAFKTNNGVTVLVNRGWIPAAMRNEVVNLPQASIIGGYLKKPDKAGMGVQNRPETGLWYWADVSAINDAYDTQASDMVLYQEIGNNAEYPVLFNGLPYPRNKHLQYAIFWFGMAGLLLILSFILYRKSRAQNSP